MREKVLPPNSAELLDQLESLAVEELKGWVLASGTGLALRLGHRMTGELRFFRTDDMSPEKLHSVLAQCGTYETLQESPDTLTVMLNKVKLSFFKVRDPFLYPGTPYRFFTIADIDDIALMKLAAIAGRGSCKDFIDLHKILMQGKSLREYLEAMPKKYGQERVNAYHILKSLVYFEDAEAEPMPEMLEPFDWKACKAFFVREARLLTLG